MPAARYSLALALVAACAPTHVVTTPTPAVAGNQVRYARWSDTTEFVRARLLSLDADSLTFERFVPGDPARWVPGALATDSVARLQVRVGRRNNAGRGALFGGLIGAGLGVLCAADEDAGEWLHPTAGQCMLAGTVTGVGTGLLIGALTGSDVWAPVPLPSRGREQAPSPPPVTSTRSGVGLRIPLRLPS